MPSIPLESQWQRNAIIMHGSAVSFGLWHPETTPWTGPPFSLLCPSSYGKRNSIAGNATNVDHDFPCTIGRSNGFYGCRTPTGYVRCDSIELNGARVLCRAEVRADDRHGCSGVPGSRRKTRDGGSCSKQ